MPHQRCKGLQQPVGSHWLEQHLQPGVEHLLLSLRRGFPGDQQHLQAGAEARAQSLRHGQSVRTVGQPHVAQQHLDGGTSLCGLHQHGLGFGLAGHCVDGHAVGLQQPGDSLADRGFIIDEQHVLRQWQGSARACSERRDTQGRHRRKHQAKAAAVMQARAHLQRVRQQP